MSLRVIFLVLLIKGIVFLLPSPFYLTNSLVMQISANDCYTYLIQDTTTSFTCSSSGSYSASTDLTRLIQNPSKELTVAISINPTGLCGITSDFNFLTVS